MNQEIPSLSRSTRIRPGKSAVLVPSPDSDVLPRYSMGKDGRTKQGYSLPVESWIGLAGDPHGAQAVQVTPSRSWMIQFLEHLEAVQWFEEAETSNFVTSA